MIGCTTIRIGVSRILEVRCKEKGITTKKKCVGRVRVPKLHTRFLKIDDMKNDVNKDIKRLRH